MNKKSLSAHLIKQINKSNGLAKDTFMAMLAASNAKNGFGYPPGITTSQDKIEYDAENKVRKINKD